MYRSLRFSLATAILLLAAQLAWAASAKAWQPQNTQPHTDGKNFTLGGSLQVGRAEHTATLLPNGRVLLVGGFTDADDIVTSAELYDSKTGTSIYTGSLNVPRENHTATLLANGKVLIVGGLSTSYTALASAELYDPATGTFAYTGSMATAREKHTATLLADGRVLVAGGEGQAGNGLDSAELYDPAVGAFSSVGSMTALRVDHTATLLQDGEVLIAGGGPADGISPLNSAEIYDPASQAFAATGSMIDPRSYHSATLLKSGKVLVAGGIGEIGILSSAELFDPGSGTFSGTGSMTVQRWGQTATLLKNGNVLLAAGNSLVPQLLIAEPSFDADIYKAAKGRFAATGPMITGRRNAAATLLPNGRTLLSGGVANSDENGRFLSFTENIPEVFSTGGGRCIPGTSGCGWRGGDLMTFDQFDWRNSIANAWLVDDFYLVYLSKFDVMLLGDPSGYTMLFDNGGSVSQFLPQSGNPAPLDANYVDPSATGAGAFGGDMVALQLNIDYSDAGISLGNPKIAFGDLTLCNMGALSALNGVTVREFLGQANVVLSGGSGLYPLGTYDSLAQVLNNSFAYENPSTFAQQNLVNGSCP